MNNAQRLNVEIITEVASQKGFNYNGENLFTYPEWLKRGYVVVRGQTAFIKTRLWNEGKNRRKVPASLFTLDQVTKVSNDCLIVI